MKSSPASICAGVGVQRKLPLRGPVCSMLAPSMSGGSWPICTSLESASWISIGSTSSVFCDRSSVLPVPSGLMKTGVPAPPAADLTSIWTCRRPLSLPSEA